MCPASMKAQVYSVAWDSGGESGLHFIFEHRHSVNVQPFRYIYTCSLLGKLQPETQKGHKF